MRNLIKSIIRGLPLGLLEHLTRPQLVCPFYHVVSDEPGPYLTGRYAIKSQTEFEADLDWLLRRYKPIGLGELLRAACEDKPLPKRSLFLSFDDGYREMAEVIAPILSRKGIPATFFICSSLIDNKTWFFEDRIGLILDAVSHRPPEMRDRAESTAREYGLDLDDLYAIRSPQHPGIPALGQTLGIDWNHELKQRQPYLRSEQVQDLIEHGFAIGSHSIDHPLFCELTLDEQLRQIRVSMDRLVDRFGLDYRVFSFPYGEFGVDCELFDEVFEKSFVECLFGTRGVIPDERGLRCVQRLGMEVNRETSRARMRSALGDKLIRKIARNDTVTR